MNASLELLQALGAASLPAFWLPTAVWTAGALAALALLRGVRPRHPLQRYAFHAALLAALPVALGASALLDLGHLPGSVASPLPLPAEASGPPAAEPGPAAGTLFDPAALLGLGTCLALALAAVRLLRLGADALSLRRLIRSLDADGAPPALRSTLHRMAARLAVRRRVRIAVTARDVVPLTVGWRRPLIVVPSSLLADEEQLAMAVAHELVHVRRGDAVLHRLETAVGALFYFHPLVHLLRRRITADREMACDAEVLAGLRFDPGRYARLLYRYVLPPGERHPTAVAMADAPRTLKKRLLAMKRFDSLPRPTRRTLWAASVALVVGTSVLVAACTDLVDVNSNGEHATAQSANAVDPSTTVYRVYDEMPRIVGGLAALQREIQYPRIAKLAGVEGKVFVEFVVDAEGRVSDAKVTRGIGAGCDEEAVRVLKAATFTPGRENGRAVPVRMQIPFTFKLDDGTSAGTSG